MTAEAHPPGSVEASSRSGYTRRVPPKREQQILRILERISSQLEDVVDRLESIEQLVRAPGGAGAGEEFDEARARIARERQNAAEEQERPIDAVRRSLSEHDLISE
jgi:hypothetical protein